MRPLRLDVEGFTVFRELTVVDFDGVDFFALVGPTGSGKSTLLDAVCFALYGTVPRWADQRGVASALAPSSSQARVRLVFEANGGRYVASRVVSRDGKGRVKTSLAGLQRLPDGVSPADLDGAADGDAETVLGEVLAATPKEMDAAVPQVLGLPYEHFVTCVVLPQGAFAQFLHAKPSERGDILVNLLGLHAYRRIATRAGEVARDSAARAEAADQLLGSLGGVDQEAVDAAAERAAAMRELRAEVDAEAPALAAAQQAAAEAQRRLGELDAAVEALGAVSVPDDVPTLSARIAAAAEATAAAERRLAEAERAEDDARTAAETAPDPADLRRVLEAHDQVTELTARRDELAAAAEAAETKLAAARERQQAAADQVETAELDQVQAQRTELAGALRPHLATGEPCPVCAQEVRTLPEPLDATALRAAEKALAEARTAKTAADRTVHDTERELATARTRLAETDTRLAEVRAVVTGHDDRAAVVALLERADALRQAWRQAGAEVRDSRQAYQRARAAEEQARAATGEAWSRLQATRDALSTLGPPPLDRDALDTAWSQLVTWADETAGERGRQRPAAEAAVEAAGADVERAADRIRALFDTRGLTAPEPLDPTGISTAAAVAVTQAEAEQQRVADQLAQIGRHREDRDRYTQEARVAKALADHLRANNFERWLLEEALDTLVEGASAILAELSGAQYELGHESGEFYVLDHHDADLRRPVRTLSGGETFQASLALALALSEQLAGMSDTSTALESIILDEGFGTLDSATLDTVAATLENLAARGDRVVGVVTHVPELADRVPVRFAVSKDARSAHVERVS